MFNSNTGDVEKLPILRGVKAGCPNRTNWITRSCVKLAGNLPNATQYLTILINT